MQSRTAVVNKLPRWDGKEVRSITLRVPQNVLHKIKYRVLRNGEAGRGETTVQGFVYAAVLERLRHDQETS
jgi:hypothetical protein